MDMKSALKGLAKKVTECLLVGKPGRFPRGIFAAFFIPIRFGWIATRSDLLTYVEIVSGARSCRKCSCLCFTCLALERFSFGLTVRICGGHSLLWEMYGASVMNGPVFWSFFGSWTNGAVLDVWFSFSSESLPRSLLRSHVHLNGHGQSKRKMFPSYRLKYKMAARLKTVRT